MSSPDVLRHVEVILLTGHRLDIICDPSNTCLQIFNTVVAQLSLKESYYFGLSYVIGKVAQKYKG